MAVTYSDVYDSVNRELQNHDKRGSASYVADGEVASFYVAPLGSFVMDDDTFAVYVDGVLVTTYTMDYESGVLDFDDAPSSGSTIEWVFNYRHWSDDLVSGAVYAGVDNLFPYFYANSEEELSPDGETYEFDIGTAEAVRHVLYTASGGTSYSRLSRSKYVVEDDGDMKYLRFYSAPSTGTLKVQTIERPTLAKLPARAIYPLTSYSCYYLLNQKVAQRVRSDVAIVTQGSGTLSPRQMNDASNSFYLRYQMQLAQMRMKPWAVI